MIGMKYIRRAMSLVAAVSLACMMQGCFTGVDSTPKITYHDVKREKIVRTAEQDFLSGAVPERPSEWRPGKRFYVTDPKISIVFSSMSTAEKDSLAGGDIVFDKMYAVQSVTGEDVTEIEFSAPDGGKLYYRVNIPFAGIGAMSQLEVPFTIERSVVDSVASAIKGKRYYAVSAMWYTPDGSRTVRGLRHVAVDIADVQPGNSVYPLRIVFTDEESGAPHSMYMTVGEQRTSTRNFHTLFAFDNPRSKYPYISDDTWELIKHSKVKLGMTRGEVRLALGAPKVRGQRPTTSGMVEYWQYSEGYFLLFEDDVLVRM